MARRARLRSGERRASIVAAAARLFAEKGFRGATTRELAAAVGVTEPVLYQHFKTKNELYAAIIESKVAGSREPVAKLRAGLESGDDRKVLSLVAGIILDRYREDPEFIRLYLFSALERHEMAGEFYRTRVAAFYDLLAGYLRRRMREGALRKVNPARAARCFIGMIQEHALAEVLFEQPGPRPGRGKLIGETVSVFLDGIRPRGDRQT